MFLFARMLSLRTTRKIGIVDANGKIVARLISTQSGEAIISCGAKVALITDYEVVNLD